MWYMKNILCPYNKREAVTVLSESLHKEYNKIVAALQFLILTANTMLYQSSELIISYCKHVSLQ